MTWPCCSFIPCLSRPSRVCHVLRPSHVARVPHSESRGQLAQPGLYLIDMTPMNLGSFAKLGLDVGLHMEVAILQDMLHATLQVALSVSVTTMLTLVAGAACWCSHDNIGVLLAGSIPLAAYHYLAFWANSPASLNICDTPTAGRNLRHAAMAQQDTNHSTLPCRKWRSARSGGARTHKLLQLQVADSTCNIRICSCWQPGQHQDVAARRLPAFPQGLMARYIGAPSTGSTARRGTT